MKIKQRFKIVEFKNPRTKSTSWRVTGTRRNGDRVRENFTDSNAAQCRQVELEGEFFTAPSETHLRATKLTETQLHLAEVAFKKLDDDADILRAVDNWLTSGKPGPVIEAPWVDDAVKQFCDWLEKSELSEPTKKNLRLRVNIFANSIGRMRLNEATADVIFTHLENRNVSKETRNNDRRALSRFFGWCIERPRKWITTNPARKETRERNTGDKAPPAILTLAECEKLLRFAEAHKGGRLAPYVAVCLFGGLRPSEAERLTWDKVNLTDREIRIEKKGKTTRPRVLDIIPMIQNGHLRKGPSTLLKWLERYKDKPFYPSNWRRDFDVLKHAIGYNGANRKGVELVPHLKQWPEDVMRHTAISHYFRLTGSYGQTAEQFGNSESIVKKHYQARVTTEDTKRFYKLLPKGKGK